MYQYKYIPVDTGGGFLSDTREHRELIDAYAAEGWRYIGFFPVSFTGHGVALQTSCEKFSYNLQKRNGA